MGKIPLFSITATFFVRLAVMDDQPREEFSPRQRHTLKEFAVRSFSGRVSAQEIDGFYRPLQCVKWNSGEIK